MSWTSMACIALHSESKKMFKGKIRC